MGKGGGGGGSQTQTTKTEPWEGQKKYLEQGFGAAQANILNRPQSYFPGSTVAPLSGQTQAGINTLAHYGANPPGWQNSAKAQVGHTAAGGYANANPAMGGLANIGAGGLGMGPGAAIGQFQNMANLAYGEGYGLPTFQQAQGGGMDNRATGLAGQLTGGPNDITSPLVYGAASGQMLNANPYLDSMMDRASEGIIRNYTQSQVPGIDSAFARSGRLGSGMQAYARRDADRQLGESLGNTAQDIYAGNYQNERQLQAQAQGLLGQLQGQNFGQKMQAVGLYGQLGSEDAARRLQGASSAQGVFQQGLQNRMAGAQSLQGAFDADAARRLSALGTQGQLYDAERGRMMQAAALAPAMQGMDLNNINAMLQAGGMVDQQSQAMLQDQVDRWNFAQQEPGNRAAQYLAAVGGGNYGSSTSQTIPQTRNRGASVLGGGLSGAVLGNMIAPGYAGIGAVAGGLLGLF